MTEPFSLLVVSPRLPAPTGKADSRTVFRMIEFLAGRGHRVHLAAFVDSEARPESIPRLRELCTSLDLVPLSALRAKLQAAMGLFSDEPLQVRYFRHGAMRRAVERVIQAHSPQILYGHMFRSAQYLMPYRSIPKVLGLLASYTLNYRRLLDHLDRPAQRLLYGLEYRRIRRYEPRIMQRFERVLLISPHDLAAVDGGDRFRNVFFNPHGVEVQHYAEDLGLARETGSIVLNADFAAPTNVDAALFFHREIFPTVRRAVPNARLWLVGRRPTSAVRRLAADPDVTVTGFVEDLRPYLQRAAVAVDPLRAGAGLQNKVLVSMAAGLPVVLTPIANEGIDLPPDLVLLAAEPQEFARQVIRLLREPELGRRLGERGRRFVLERWSWEFHFAKFEEMIADLMRRGGDGEIRQYYPFPPVRRSGADHGVGAGDPLV
ncbi:MAG: glycosyltransferase [Thermoanaerobaculia bacterium]